MSSISAHVGAPYQTAYCGTKGAISMLAKALGANLGEHGIRVNAVEPGWVKTPMDDASQGEGAYGDADITDHVPMGRFASTIAYLLSDDASYVTSATLLADGGFIVNAEM